MGGRTRVVVLSSGGCLGGGRKLTPALAKRPELEIFEMDKTFPLACDFSRHTLDGPVAKMVAPIDPVSSLNTALYMFKY